MPGGNGHQYATQPRPVRRQTDNALSGAVIAFAKSQPSKSNTTKRDSQAKAAASSAAGSKQLGGGSNTPVQRRSPRRTPSPLATQPTSSNISENRRAIAGRDLSRDAQAASTTFRSNAPPNLAPSSTKEPTFSRSPPTIAIESPKSRYSPSHAAASAAAIKTAQKLQPVSPLSPSTPNLAFEEDQEDVLPAPGTVEEVKKWLQSLDGGDDVKKSYATESAGLSRSQTLRASRNSSSYDAFGGSIIKSDDSENSRPESRARSMAAGPEIVSPKPLRPPTTLGDRKLDEASLPLSMQLHEHPANEARLSLTSSNGPPQPMFRRSLSSPVLLSETSTQAESTDYEQRDFLSPASDQRVGHEIDNTVPKSLSTRPTHPLLPQRSASATFEVPSGSLMPPTIAVPRRSQTSVSSQSLLRPRRHTGSTNQDVPLTKDSIHRVESLANAIVASHLASSRAPSPTRPGSALPVRRPLEKRYKPFQQFKKHKQNSRTPSPSKGVQYTMRKDVDSTDDEEPNPHKRRRRRFFNKHPNKHHEGDRKRWRDIITEQERKRYEGVWAANRGIHLTYTSGELEKPSLMDSANQNVSNLVVRDIWSRSRLPHHVLEEAWELVDQQENGRLGREEFVVGLWLVDQRLKGRKLPYRVGDSVWKSVRGIYGLKIPKR